MRHDIMVVFKGDMQPAKLTVNLTENQIRDILACIKYREASQYPPYEDFFKRYWYIKKELSDAIGLEMKFGEPE